jgi:signal transduction histidine kinase
MQQDHVPSPAIARGALPVALRDDRGAAPDEMTRRVGAIVHDFNNSLQAIASVLALLQHRAGCGGLGDVNRLMTIALESTDKAHLHMRRLTAVMAAPPAAAVPVDVNALLADCASLWGILLGEKTELVLRLSAQAVTLVCDRQGLEDMILNLVVNARDAMPEGGTVTIETAVLDLPGGGRRVALRVSDTGTGMSPDCAARACEAYFTTKGARDGSGLGLWSARCFAQSHGGELAIESVEGAGTSIRILLAGA